MVRTFAVAVILCLLLAGCNQAKKDGEPTPTNSASSSTTPTNGAGLGNGTLSPANVTYDSAPFNLVGHGCHEFLVMTTITVARARLFVPTNYSISGQQTGNAVAFGGLKVCLELLIDGVSIGSGSTSDVGVNIDSPDGSDGNHYYQTWWLSNHKDLAGRLAAQGWRGNLTNETVLTTTFSQGAGEASFAVDWMDGAYQGRGTVASGPLPPALTFTGWHDGANGTVKIRKTLTSTAAGSGTGALTAQGPMSDLFGPTASGVGIWNEYGMTGSVGAHS